MDLSKLRALLVLEAAKNCRFMHNSAQASDARASAYARGIRRAPEAPKRRHSWCRKLWVTDTERVFVLCSLDSQGRQADGVGALFPAAGWNQIEIPCLRQKVPPSGWETHDRAWLFGDGSTWPKTHHTIRPPSCPIVLFVRSQACLHSTSLICADCWQLVKLLHEGCVHKLHPEQTPPSQDRQQRAQIAVQPCTASVAILLYKQVGKTSGAI
jgi:hypothetical protein